MMMLVNIDEEETSRNDMSHVRYCIGMAAVLLFAAIAMFLLNGCGKKEEPVAMALPEEEKVVTEEPELPEMSAHAGDEMTEEEILNITAGAASDSSSNEEYVADAADVPDDVTLVEFPNLEDDPNELFRVSEDWAAEHKGLYAKIGEEFYSLTNQLPVDIVQKYGFGYVIAPEGSGITTDSVGIYLRDVEDVISDVPTNARHATVTCGDFSPLKLHRNDSIVIFGEASTKFYKAEFVGFTIPAYQADTDEKYYPIVDHVMPNNKLIDYPGLFTLDEQPVEDVRNLEYGKEYLYEYYIGTDYYEIKTVADAKCYTTLRDSVILESRPTKNGYFTVDISSLEPGFYANFTSDVIFEIVD